MATDSLAISKELAAEGHRSEQSYAPRIRYTDAIDWILRADKVAETLPNGPHNEYAHIYWTEYLGWINEERIDVGEPARAGLASALVRFLDNSLEGLQEDVWVPNRLDKGLHIINVATAFETFDATKEPCDALRRILNHDKCDSEMDLGVPPLLAPFTAVECAHGTGG